MTSNNDEPDAAPSAQSAAAWGLWSNYASPQVIGSLSASGAPWVCIDEQHGYPPADLAACVGAGLAHGAEVLVRVAWNRPELIGRALDAGATGVIVPMVQNAAEARAAAQAAHYPPSGARSFGPARRAFGIDAGYGVPVRGEEPRCLVMVESAEALDAVEEIAAVEGVDGIFVGPFDLSLALGIPLDALLADRTASGPLGRVVAACRAAGIVAAGYAGTPARARVLSDHGLTLIAAMTDDALLAAGYPQLRDELG